MSQRLIMPFTRQMMLCGYKVRPYREHWGYNHFGIDVSTIQGGAGEDHNVYASGEGTVLAAGEDSGVGGALVLEYPDCLIRATGEVCPLVARYFHLASLAVKPGDTVVTGTPLGVEGNAMTTDYHLHLELDRDTEYPLMSPQVAGGSLILAGIDTTVNPSHVLHLGPGQQIVPPTYNPAWLNPEDREIPLLPAEDELSLLRARLGKLAAELAKARALAQSRLALLEKIAALAKTGDEL